MTMTSSLQHVTPRGGSTTMQYDYSQQDYYGTTAQQDYPQQGYGTQQDYGGAQGAWCVDGPTGQCCLQPGGEKILGRFDARVQKTTISRQQCVVRVDYEGSATVMSLGKPLTGWRAAAGTPWQWLRNGDERVIFNGAQLSLDQTDPEGEVFTIQEQAAGGAGQTQGYGQAQGYGQTQGYEQPQQGYGQQQNLPAGWIAGVDEASGHTYYYNEQTGQSQWEPPQ
uniref:WW domain-containing protein n=1 Tax=Prymnesium polylepis TaxID=72548 RepID=A0A7S4MY15_9EUKA